MEEALFYTTTKETEKHKTTADTVLDTKEFWDYIEIFKELDQETREKALNDFYQRLQNNVATLKEVQKMHIFIEVMAEVKNRVLKTVFPEESITAITIPQKPDIIGRIKNLFIPKIEKTETNSIKKQLKEEIRFYSENEEKMAKEITKVIETNEINEEEVEKYCYYVDLITMWNNAHKLQWKLENKAHNSSKILQFKPTPTEFKRVAEENGVLAIKFTQLNQLDNLCQQIQNDMQIFANKYENLQKETQIKNFELQDYEIRGNSDTDQKLQMRFIKRMIVLKRHLEQMMKEADMPAENSPQSIKETLGIPESYATNLLFQKKVAEITEEEVKKIKKQLPLYEQTDIV